MPSLNLNLETRINALNSALSKKADQGKVDYGRLYVIIDPCIRRANRFFNSIFSNG
jgi:hypothetical protein